MAPRLIAASALAALAAGTPFLLRRLYQAQRRREAEERLRQALEGTDSSALALACTQAEEADLDPSLLSVAKEELALRRAEEELREAMRTLDYRQILRALVRSKVGDALREEATSSARELLRADLEGEDVARILMACACAEEAKLPTRSGRNRARELAESQLRREMGTGDSKEIVKFSRLAEAAGASKELVAEGRALALRLQAESELRAAAAAGSAERLRAALARAEEVGLEEKALEGFRAEEARLRAEALLLEALQQGSGARLSAALRRAERCGAGAVALARGREELERLESKEQERRSSAEAELAAAMGALEEGPERLYRACRQAEEAGVEPERVAAGRGEARRRFDLAELQAAMREGDAKRAFVATGGSLPTLPLER